MNNWDIKNKYIDMIASKTELKATKYNPGNVRHAMIPMMAVEEGDGLDDLPYDEHEINIG